MDYRIYHAVNQFVFHHAWLGRALSHLETWAVPIVAVATVALWSSHDQAQTRNGN